MLYSGVSTPTRADLFGGGRAAMGGRRGLIDRNSFRLPLTGGGRPGGAGAGGGDVRSSGVSNLAGLLESEPEWLCCWLNARGNGLAEHIVVRC